MFISTRTDANGTSHSRKKQICRPTVERRLAVTICAAAICKLEGQEVVLAIADRMRTSGDHEFETTQMKFFQFRPSCFVLGSGDEDTHSDIAFETERGISVSQSKETVRDIAHLYSRNFAILRSERAERKFLAPLNLDGATFIAKQKQMRPEFVLKLNDQLQSEQLGVCALVFGVDSTGPNIYLVEDPGTGLCLNGTGYGTIGTGGRQAKSLFLSAGFTRQWPFDRTLLQLYSAKRRAEVAPGVGGKTDILCIGREGVLKINEQDNKELANFLVATHREANEKAQAFSEGIVKTLNEQFKIKIPSSNS